jgi:hypothetical protein
MPAEYQLGVYPAGAVGLTRRVVHLADHLGDHGVPHCAR